MTATIEAGEFAGWTMTARADFPARLLASLQSSRVGEVLEVLEAIVVEHNLPDSEGLVAERLGDVDPYDGLLVVAGELLRSIARLPPR